jgi:hypothetical protein
MIGQIRSTPLDRPAGEDARRVGAARPPTLVFSPLPNSLPSSSAAADHWLLRGCANRSFLLSRRTLYPHNTIVIVEIFTAIASNLRCVHRIMLAAASISGADCGGMETAFGSSLDRPAVDGPKDRQRSRITNGSALLPGVDGRSPWVRRCKDVIAAHLSDLGGEANTSTAERSIVRRAAVLTAQLEQLEVRFALANGEVRPEDLDLYQRTANSLRRLLEAVGLQRRAKNITPPDPLEYARERSP